MRKEGEVTFAEKHPRLNFLLGLILITLLAVIILWIIRLIFSFIGDGINSVTLFLKNFVNNTDKVIVVAMITGSVSMVGVIFSSMIAKVVDYKYNVKKYLYDKRERPYEQFINMVYTIMANTKKFEDQKMTEEEMVQMISEFSKGLTLWGSNRVVKKWLKYRKNSLQNSNADMLLLLEDIIYEIRRDVGLGKRLKKGDMLSFFINDIETLIKK